MNFPNIKIAYYSGTGGTKMIADCFARQLEDMGVGVDIQSIPAGSKGGPKGCDLMILLFPVYAFRAPEPVYRWIAGLQNGEDRPSLVISVSGGGEVWPNTACRLKVIKMLEVKGYRVIHESMAVMPSNIALPTPAPVDGILVDLVPDFVAGVLHDLEHNETRRTTPGLPDRFMAGLGSAQKYGAHIFGRRICVLDSCIGCGTCAGHCPSCNIAMQDGRPVFGGKCFLCMKCFYSCPTHSLRPGVGKFAVLKDGYDLEKLQPKALPEVTASKPIVVAKAGLPASRDQLEKIVPGAVWSGVRKYILETQAKTASRGGAVRTDGNHDQIK